MFDLKYTIPWLTIFFITLLFALGGCKPSQTITQETATSEAEPIDSPLAIMFDTSRVFNNIFTGFSLYDPEEERTIYSQFEDKYFTPASNTKLFTFYAGLKALPDSLKALEYVIRGDSLIFWGAGDPVFLHPDFESSEA